MSFIKRIVVLFSVTTSLFIGSFIVLYCFGHITFSDVSFLFYLVNKDPNLSLGWGIFGITILVVNFLFFKLFSINVHRDKNIAFDNPSGRVSVSLHALEDLVRKVILPLPEVKDLKVSIKALAKGVQTVIRLTVKSDEDLPSLTARVQDIAQAKLQETIGIDDKLKVTVHVGKIIPTGKSKQKKIEKKEEPQDPGTNVPYHGFRK